MISSNTVKAFDKSSVKVISLKGNTYDFYALNIIHDILHDFGYYASPTRWIQNIKIVQEFIFGSSFTLNPKSFSMPGDIEDDDEDDDEDPQIGGMTRKSVITYSRNPQFPSTPQPLPRKPVQIKRKIDDVEPNTQEEGFTSTESSPITPREQQLWTPRPNFPWLSKNIEGTQYNNFLSYTNEENLDEENLDEEINTVKMSESSTSTNMEFNQSIHDKFIESIEQNCVFNLFNFAVNKLYYNTHRSEDSDKEGEINISSDIEPVNDEKPSDKEIEIFDNSDISNINEEPVNDTESKISDNSDIKNDSPNTEDQIVMSEISIIASKIFVPEINGYFDDTEYTENTEDTENIEDINKLDLIYDDTYINLQLLFIKYLFGIYKNRKGTSNPLKYDNTNMFYYLTDFLDFNVELSQKFKQKINKTGDEVKSMNIIDYCIAKSFINNSKQDTSNFFDDTQIGGAISDGSYDVLKPLVTNISNIAYNSEEKKNIDAILNGTYKSESPNVLIDNDSKYTLYAKDTYNSLKDALIKQIFDKINEYYETNIDINDKISNKIINNEKTKAKFANNLIESLPFKYKNDQKVIARFDTNYDKYMDELLSPYNKAIKDYEDTKQKEEQQELREKLKEQLEKEKKERQAAKEAAKQASDQGLGQNEPIRDEYLKLISYVGLDINIQTNVNGMVPPINESDTGSELYETELEILSYYSNIVYNGINIKGKKNLDTVLLTNIKKYVEDKFSNFVINDDNDNGYGQYYCNKGPTYLKYIIDNAAILPQSVRENLVFCPSTSIIDGMLQCTLGSLGSYGVHDIELGDMHFRVQNDTGNSYYEGQLNINVDNPANIIDTPNGSAEYIITYKPLNTLYPAISVSADNIKIKDSKIKNLEAKNALANSLISILQFIETNYTTPCDVLLVPNNKLGEYLISNNYNLTDPLNNNNGKNVLSNIIYLLEQFKNYLTRLITPPDWTNNDTLNQYQQLLVCIFTVLTKGAGDIFQEINAVCKYGGYTKIHYTSDNIIQWNDSYDALRLFAANDRPSASRAIVILLNGDKNEINNLALGGYISKLDPFIVANQHAPTQNTQIDRSSSSSSKKSSSQINIPICEWSTQQSVKFPFSNSLSFGGKNKSIKKNKKNIKKYTKNKNKKQNINFTNKNKNKKKSKKSKNNKNNKNYK